MTSNSKNTNFKVSGKQPLNTVGLFTFLRTYSRRHEENNPKSTIESWEECLTRVVKASNQQLGVGFTPEEQQEFFDLLYNLKCSVAGRFMWQLGTKTVDKLGMNSLQNCSAVVVDSPVDPFTWAMNFLMLGSGVGFRILPSDVAKLPIVKYAQITRKDTNDADFIVPDSREGWVKLLGRTLKAHFYSGKNFTYSCILLRSKGAPIKGFGGLASGPEVLCDGIEKIQIILNKRAEHNIRPIDALDIMNIIGGIVISGNVRRSALLALGDCNDQEYIKAKRWDLGTIPNYRAFSNNSIVCNDINEIINNTEFWTGYEGNGEPYGLINLGLMRKCGRLGETQYSDPDVECVNPCSEQTLNNYESCVSGDTLIHTKDGCYPIKNLVGKIVDIYNGEDWSEVEPFLAKEKDQFYKIVFSDGSLLKATSYHEFSVSTPTNKKKFNKVACEDLKVGMYLPKVELPSINQGLDTKMAYTIGAFLGDGYMDNERPMLCCVEDVCEVFFNNCNVGKYGKMWKNDDRKKYMYRAGINRDEFTDIDFWKNLRDCDTGLPEEIMKFSKKSILELIAGWIDTDGSIRNKDTSSEGFIICGGAEKKLRDLQILVRRVGINFASIRLQNKIGENTNYGTRKKNIWVLQIPTFECEKIPTVVKKINKFGSRFKINPAYITSDKIDNARRQRIISIEKCSETEPSYCFSESIRGMGVFGNVLTYQCCLSELYLPNINSKEELFRCARYLYRVCKHSLRLKCENSKDTEKVVHKNMRMGIGVTGYLQATEEKRSWLSDCYEMLRTFDKEYSIKHGFPTSVKLTTVKPSGCSRKDMLVQTNKGLLRLDEIGDVDGTEWQDVNGLTVTTDQEGKQEKITKFYINGEVNTRKIITEDGVKLESSLNHRYRILKGEYYIWRNVGELEVGDKLLVKTGGHPEDITTVLKKCPGIEIKETVMTLDIAWYIGVYFGMILSKDNNMHSTKLIVRLRKLYNSIGLPIVKNEKGEEVFRTGMLDRWLKYNGYFHENMLENKEKMEIPKNIRMLSKDNVNEFLIGFSTTFDQKSSLGEQFEQQLMVLSRSVDFIKSFGIIDNNRIWNDFLIDEIKHINGYISHNTLSLLAGVTSGVHPAFAKYYIRRIRISSESPLIKLAKDNGYHVEYVRKFDGTLDHSTQVIEFPYKLPDGTILADNCTAIQQLEYAKRMQTEWSDNSISITCYYRKEELPAIKQWLKTNYNNSVKSVSFLLHYEHGFDQAPLEKISKEDYEKIMAKVNRIESVEGICYNAADEEIATESDCAGGVCTAR
jgi:hypothetical protein